MRKRLFFLVFLGSLLFLASCTAFPDYEFNGMIGDEQVRLEEPYIGIYSYKLTVSQKDRTIVYEAEYNNDSLKLCRVSIEDKTGKKEYTGATENSKIILSEAEKKFNWYLQEIKRINLEKGLKDLK